MKYEKKKLNTKLGEIPVSIYEKDGKELIAFNPLHTEMEKMSETIDIKITECHERGGIDFYPVVIVKISINGKIYIGVGDGKWDTLPSEIDRNFAVKITVNRAYSDAYLQALGLAGKYYTSEQIKDTPKSKSDKKSEPVAEAAETKSETEVSETVSEPVQEQRSDVMEDGFTPTEASSTPFDEQEQMTLGTASESVQEPETKEKPEENEDEEVTMDSKFKSGKYKGKTLAEVMESDKGFVIFVNSHATPVGALVEDQKMVRKAVELGLITL